jgi:hypothetical protein
MFGLSRTRQAEHLRNVWLFDQSLPGRVRENPSPQGPKQSSWTAETKGARCNHRAIAHLISSAWQAVLRLFNVPGWHLNTIG